MHKLALALGLFLSPVTAEYTTTLLDATATTYALSCPLAVGNACGVPASLLITQGPSTLHYAFPTGSGDMTADCKLTGTQGVCSGSILATGAQHRGGHGG
ncbi:hypothetical protein VE04_09279, partial [Pseudogymnoascus sp. 24MN13]